MLFSIETFNNGSISFNFLHSYKMLMFFIFYFVKSKNARYKDFECCIPCYCEVFF